MWFWFEVNIQITNYFISIKNQNVVHRLIEIIYAKYWYFYSCFQNTIFMQVIYWHCTLSTKHPRQINFFSCVVLGTYLFYRINYLIVVWLKFVPFYFTLQCHAPRLVTRLTFSYFHCHTRTVKKCCSWTWSRPWVAHPNIVINLISYKVQFVAFHISLYQQLKYSFVSDTLNFAKRWAIIHDSLSPTTHCPHDESKPFRFV